MSRARIFCFAVYVLSLPRLALSQKEIQCLDSLHGQPLVGVQIVIPKMQLVVHTDFDGKASLPVLHDQDEVILSCLGFQRKSILYSDLITKVYLARRSIVLSETFIRPLTPRRIVELAFDSFYRNHLPFPYVQNMFYREEYIINNEYFKFQELLMQMYQYPKNGDVRQYYIAGSVPKVKQSYIVVNKPMHHDVLEKMGKLVASRASIDQVSLYSYAKGVNILNLIFSEILLDEKVEYAFGPSEYLHGIQTIHVEAKHYVDRSHFCTSHLLLHPSTYAVMQYTIIARSDDITSEFEYVMNIKPDFTTKALLWLMGVRYKFKKFYCKISFHQNHQGIWSVSDYLAMFPFEFQRRKFKLDGYIHMTYKMDTAIHKISEIPIASKVYGKNSVIMRESMQSQTMPKSPLRIPLIPSQQERLKRVLLPSKY